MPAIDQLADKEKINIYVDEETFSTLEHDMDVFEVCRKKNGEINRNDFLARLIVNYGRQYRESADRVRGDITNTLKKYWPKGKYYYDLVTADILSVINKKDTGAKEHTDMILAFRPQKKNEELQFELEDISIYLSEREGISVSDYFRSMLESYCRMIQSERERIILLKTYNEIASAIRGKRVVRITGTDGESFLCTPYALVTNKAGQHNYLVGIVDGQVVPRILSRIRYIKRTEGKYEIPAELKEVLDERKKNPEFALQEEQDIYVLFNETGLTELKVMKTGRPKRVTGTPEIPAAVAEAAEAYMRKTGEERQLLVFRSTPIQAHFYFRRFGQNAYVIAPEELNRQLAEYFRSAADSYSV